MRRIKNPQLPFTLVSQDTARFRELEGISEIIDANPRMSELVHSDLSRDVASNKGAKGLSADQVLRILVVKQRENYSYEALEFHLNDSSSYRWFCRLEWGDTVSKSALQRDLSKLRPETLEQINRILVGYAQEQGIESGRKVRTDCTAVASAIHEPSDSSLLWDGVRVLTRLMKQGKSEVPEVKYTDHTRRAKKRAYYAIDNAKNNQQRRPLYEDLLAITQKTVGYAEQAVETLKGSGSVAALACAATLCHIIGLTKKVIEQTQRRVIEGQSVPAQDKIVSIFEPHADVIAKGKRDPVFGHKICVTGGASGMILDCVILDGNPADATLTTDMMARIVDIYGQAPRQAVFDGAFRSIVNLNAVKDMGVQDVVFTKAPGLDIEDMAKSKWVYKRLRRFRAGIEGTISFLKRTFGLVRCTWRGLTSFKSYVWSSILSANLLVVARHAAEQ